MKKTKLVYLLIMILATSILFTGCGKKNDVT